MRTSAPGQEGEWVDLREAAGDRFLEERMALVQANRKKVCVIVKVQRNIRWFEVIPQSQYRSNPFLPRTRVWNLCLGIALEERPGMSAPWPVGLICPLAWWSWSRIWAIM